MWDPDHISPRLSAQSGLFTIAANPLKSYIDGIFYKITIKKESKKNILSILEKYGIHSASLFPGLDGLAKYIEDEHFALRGFKDKKLLIKALESAFKERALTDKKI